MPATSSRKNKRATAAAQMSADPPPDIDVAVQMGGATDDITAEEMMMIQNDGDDNHAKTNGGATTKATKAKSSPASNNNKRQKKSTTAGGGTASTAATATTSTTTTMTRTTIKDIIVQMERLVARVPAIPDDQFGVLPKTTTTTNGDNGDNSDVKGKETATTTTTTTTTTIPKPKRVCPYDKDAMRRWALTLQAILDEFALIVALVGPATYTWGIDRSGSAEQNLSVLSQELVRSQEQLNGRVTPRLNDILTPVVSLVTDKTITTRREPSDATAAASATAFIETKQNYYCHCLEDPDYLEHCYDVLANKSPMMVRIVTEQFGKVVHCLRDYQTASEKDNQSSTDNVRGFMY